MIRIVLKAAFALCAIYWTAAAADRLEEGFRTPPREARLRCYWWWLNGNVTKQSITRDLEEMKAKGYGGALVIDAGGAEQRNNDQVPAGPLFGSPEWRVLFRHAVQTADRLGLELSLNILSGWNLGGPTVKPEHAAKLVTWSATVVKGPSRISQTLETPRHRDGFYRDIAVLAYPLRHGADLPSEKGARKPIQLLPFKAVFREFGGSTPDTVPLLRDRQAEQGEEDTRISGVRDVTARMGAGGSFQWDAPAGEWEILRFGYTPSGSKVSTSSGDWKGAVLDYLDHTALETYWRDVIDPILADVRPYCGKALRYAVTDSWELNGVNWTPRFREEFRKRRGYDILPYLPAFTGRIVESRDVSNRFLADLRKTVSDLVADEHYSAFAALSKRYGLDIHPEAGGPHGAPIDALKMLGRCAFPQMEYWAKSPIHRVKDEDRFFVKQAASAAHIYGKTVVAAEGFTTIGPHWEESIWNNLKPTFDRAVGEGLNLHIWHTFTSSPAEMGKPGQEYFAGTHMNPNVTWWNQAVGLFGYINRVSYLMQQGKFVADVLYYYGDHVPNFVRLKTSDPARVQPGYDYDVCNEEVLLTRLSVHNGRLVLPDGMSYRMLVLPEHGSASLAALRKIRELVQAGAKVIGPKLERPTGLEDASEVLKLSAELWDSGRVVSGKTAREVLTGAGILPDFESAGGPQLDYIHRGTQDADIYFVSSQQEQECDVDAVFRVSGKAPEFWSPETGAIRMQPVYDFTADGRTSVPLHLEPYGSAVVVFRKPAGYKITGIARNGQKVNLPVFAGNPPEFETDQPGRYQWKDSTASLHATAVTAPPAPLQLSGKWTVRFAPGWGAPASTTFDGLRSWTECTDPGVKYFSGTASYEKDIEIPAEMTRPGMRLRLDLGDVREIAEVVLNGKDLGILWKRPFSLDVTQAVQAGRNHLVIRITNLWPNRLIGDQFLPPGKRFTRTNIRKYTAGSPLLPSGLLGPVEIHPIRRVPLQ